jgi:hypothetical protein
MHSIAPCNFYFNLVPGSGDQETFLHVTDHLLKFLHRDGKGQDIHRNTGSCRRIKHPEHCPGVVTFLFKPGIVDDRGAPGSKRTDDAVRVGLVEIGEREQCCQNLRPCKEDDYVRVVFRQKPVPAPERRAPAFSRREACRAVISSTISGVLL